jgi:hypothetical protein
MNILIYYYNVIKKIFTSPFCIIILAISTRLKRIHQTKRLIAAFGISMFIRAMLSSNEKSNSLKSESDP